MSAPTVEPPAPGLAAGKYLTFLLGGCAYGIPVLKVREIIRLVEITPIPRLPEYVRGVINLRGKIVPVIDLRMKFGLPDTTISNRTCIVVAHVMPASVPRLMGLIVDAMEEVHQIEAADLEPTPDFGRGCRAEFILGLARGKDHVRALLDLDRIVQDDSVILPLPGVDETPVARG